MNSFTENRFPGYIFRRGCYPLTFTSFVSEWSFTLRPWAGFLRSARASSSCRRFRDKRALDTLPVMGEFLDNPKPQGVMGK